MKVCLISLGCDKNLVDSEVMLGALRQAGFEFTDDEEEADIAVINTCCFINDAKEESIDTIIELGQRRTKGQLKALIVTGCLGQRYTKDIHAELPEVDAIVGISSIGRIVEAIDLVLKGTATDIIEDIKLPVKGNNPRVITTGGYYDYLKIAEGCDKHCTYCVIPSVRGSYRSMPMEDLVKEAELLVSKGVKELNLVAQETTLYGIDLYGRKALPELLHRLCEIKELRMLRLLYCYPEEITDELIDVIVSESKIMHYLDIPIQSGSDRILKLMGRKTTASDIRCLVDKLRTKIPDICLRTTLISGFPGETQEDHQASLDMVKELRFDRLGVFTYSKEEGTPAARMKGQVLKSVKQKRRNELMRSAAQIAFEINEGLIGKELEAIIEGFLPKEGIYVARTYRDAPGVDGYLFVSTSKELMSGDIVAVRITGTNEYDLIGELA